MEKMGLSAEDLCTRGGGGDEDEAYRMRNMV